MALTAPARQPWHVVAPSATGSPAPGSWLEQLPRATAAELARERYRRRLRRRLADLPEDLPRHLAEALARWWPLEERRRTELELTVVQPDGRRSKLQLDEPTQRIGRGPACAVRLPSPAVAEEQCELVLGDGRALLAALPVGGSTTVNGQPLAPGVPRELEVGDVIDVAPFRLLVGELRSETAKAEVAITPWRSLLLGPEPRFAALAPHGSLWLRLRCGDWRGFGSLPATFLAHAYRALGYPPPDDAGETVTDLDLALTSFLLRRTAQSLGERLGLAVEVTGPLTAAEVEVLADPGAAGWGMALVDLELGGQRSESAVVWSEEAPGPGGCPPPGLDEISFQVAVSCGWTRLRPGDVRALQAGDVILPDRWHPAGWPAGDGDEIPLDAVELLLQGHRRRARLALEPEGFHLELGPTWQLVPKGETMAIEEARVEEEAAAPIPEASEPGPETADGSPGPTLPDELEVVLSFELDRIIVPLSELREWREGTALSLSAGPQDRLRILLHQGSGSRLLGYGRAVVLDGRVGVEIERWARSLEGEA